MLSKLPYLKLSRFTNLRNVILTKLFMYPNKNAFKVAIPDELPRYIFAIDGKNIDVLFAPRKFNLRY